MNPFSAFLQPPTQRSPLAGAGEFVNQLSQLAQQKRAQAFREQESGLDNARADSYLKLQQGQQARAFSDKDQEQIQGLLAAYKQAEDQGDQVLMSRALQDLKAFGGVDIEGGTPSGSKPQPPPLPGMLPDPRAFTGTAPDQANPIGDAIATEQATRDKLRARTEAPDLSQEDFEADLIANPQSIPESAPDEVIDLDQDDPTPLQLGGLPSAGTKEFPVPEGTVDGGDLDAAETSAQSPQAAAFAPGLGGGLPVRISKGGKQLYESTGPSGRWAPMVQGVFQAAAQHSDPEFAAAGKRAQDMATKLIGVDGIAPKDAIKFAASQLENEIQNITNFRRTELGTRPKYAGGGGGMGINAKARLPLSKEMLASARFYKSENIQQGLQGYEGALASLSSSNPASQNDAINQLIAARSGKTVSDRERALYNRMSGVWEEAKKTFNMAAGEQMPALYRKQLRQLMTEARDALVEEREKRALAAQQFHTTRMRGAMSPEEIAADAAGVADAVRFGDGGGGPPEMPSPQDPNADLYQ